VRVGQTVKVKVLEVDLQRQRIALTMRLNDDALPARRSGGEGDARPSGNRGRERSRAPAPAESAMAAAFAKLKL